MKEIEIAKSWVDTYKVLTEERLENMNWNILTHKQTCQRDVPKLKKIKESIVYVENELAHHLLDEIIEDKEQAIKIYEDVGI